MSEWPTVYDPANLMLELIKQNTIKLADEHRENCAGRECTISLYLLQRLLELAGIELTEDEELKFL